MRYVYCGISVTHKVDISVQLLMKTNLTSITVEVFTKLSTIQECHWSFHKMEWKFSELGKFRESDKSMKHELGSILRSRLLHVSYRYR